MGIILNTENKKNNGEMEEQEIPVSRYYIKIIFSLFLFYSAFSLVTSPTAFHTSNRHTATFTSLTVLFLLVGGWLIYDSIKGLKDRKEKNKK